MVKKIVWTLRAKQDLTEILLYWEDRNKSNSFSTKLYLLINDEVEIIAESPWLGRKTDFENVRVKVIHSYLLFYKIIGDSIYILSIFHSRRDAGAIRF